MGNHYVYALFREDGVTPFYIGIGKGQRWLCHEKNVVPGKSHKDNLIVRMLSLGLNIGKTKLVENLDRETAKLIEIDLIYLIGREHTGGPLLNLTAGGDGSRDPTPETRRKLAAANVRRKARDGYLVSPEARQKLSIAGRGRTWHATEETRARMSQAQQGKKFSDETRAKMSIAVRARYQDPAARQKVGRKGRRPSDEAIARFVQMVAEKGHTPEVLKKISTALRGKKHGRMPMHHRTSISLGTKASWADRKRKRGKLEGQGEFNFNG